MKDIATYIMYFFWVFGALSVWPILKFWAKQPKEKINYIKWLFWVQIFWLIVSYIIINYYRSIGNQDWIHTLILPYFVGAVSWGVVILALLVIGAKSKRTFFN